MYHSVGPPVAGEDFTDIPVEIDITVQSLPTDVNSIEIFMIENAKGCESTDGSIGETRSPEQCFSSGELNILTNQSKTQLNLRLIPLK